MTAPNFHRVKRPWWRAAVEAVLLTILIFTFNIGAALLLGMIGVFMGLPFTLLDFTNSSLDNTLLSLTALAMTIAAPLLAAKLAGRNPATLLSVAGRVRARPTLIALAVTTVAYGSLWLLDLSTGDTPTPSSRTLIFIAICVVVVPVQAAAEELAFRAAIPQIVGTWTSSPWLSYGLSVPIFAAAHSYNWIGLVDIAIFAICASVLTWYTGGIEAATVLHAANNISAFMVLGLGLSNPLDNDVKPESAVITSISTVIFTAAILLAMRRWGRGMRNSFYVTNPQQPGLTRRVAYFKEAPIGGEEKARRPSSGKRP
ncbi:CPBP family intramembrane glutamic endopeptidase [Corynebacterium mayonis]|uniref:CPBP family intramembrane glutamic endopeptidase n=1 Tax=Corynebacterium mayonis TaxID=3062461 RepID=UPI00314056A8